MSQAKLQEKLAHVRGELKRARARILELEGQLAALRPAIVAIGDAVLEQTPKPKGYEHLAWPAIRAIAGTCATQASRAGQSQDEVFTEKGTS